MKKKGIIIGIIVLAIAIIVFYLLTRPETVGNINHSYSEPTTNTSDISFAGETGDRIKFSFRSDIEIGDLYLFLYDSKGNEVYKLDKAKALETFFDVNNTDTYTLVAECKDFIGEYSVNIYKVSP